MGRGKGLNLYRLNGDKMQSEEKGLFIVYGLVSL